MERTFEEVKAWEEKVNIPTYEIGEADKNPIFSERRVYQGSSGRVYPYPVIEKICDEKVDKEYKAVYLENKYIKVMILPELGGRIQRAYDKTNDYDFVYYNKVIKPALVGLTGPWISGGIEFNWPQHHRPTTFSPVDYMIKENEDGSKTVLVNDVDQMYGTKGIAAFTLYPDKAYIEIKGQLYNRTPLEQTFLWWANPAVAVNDYTQSIFPPDVHAVMDHGKRDVSRFPIATGVYYKHDYSAGVDISRYKNIPVPTSYMAEKSEYNFVGGYDHSLRAGILHVADHHISPGKKQWTWGCGDFGKAWDRNLTDEDGPYIELMTGVYTDNQPDFTWLKPFEEKTFKQYFMPYKAVGEVKNASIDAAVNLKVKEDGVYICVYATGENKDARIILKNKNEIVMEQVVNLSPVEIYEDTIKVQVEKESDLSVYVVNSAGKELISYKPVGPKIEEVPKPAEAAKAPREIMTNEELYLTGLHIEQYRHATYDPDEYYLEGLARDAGDIRINNAYGKLLLRRGLFKESEKYFRKAIERLIWKNPNPYNSEAYYNLGLTLVYQGRDAEAFDYFYKATWSNEQQEMSFYYLAAISAKKGDFEEALDFVNKGLVKNCHNIKARGLKARILRNLGKVEEGKVFIKESLAIDPFDYMSIYEGILLKDGDKKEELEELNSLMRNFHENFLQIARDYGEGGGYEEAIEVLNLCTMEKPMLKYYEGYYYGKLDLVEEAVRAMKEAEAACAAHCFPNKLEDILALNYAIKINPDGAKVYYYLGNLNYDKKQYGASKELWEKSAELDGTFPTVFRNLALVYYNKFNMPQEAKISLEKAFELDKTDARVFLELDQLYKKLGKTPKERIAFCEANYDTMALRDDMFIEYVTLKNLIGNYEEAYSLIMGRKFHPWEGGEGKVTTQYTTALVQMAKKALKAGEYEKAIDILNSVLVYPENLGEGKLEGTKDNHIFYYLGCAYEALGQDHKAKEAFEAATIGTDEPAGMMYYNDQPADMILFQGLAKIKLQRPVEANARFYRLVDYGERHVFDEVKIEYFAVSLPDFMIFNEDWNRRNKAHCYYLMGLGNIGLGNEEKGKEYLEKTLELDMNHQNAGIYLSGM